MRTTNCLDSKFEVSMTKDLFEDTDLQKAYIDVVNNNSKTATATTMKNLYSFTTFYAMNDDICERMFKDKKYLMYVLSKTLYHRAFLLDAKEKLDLLWPTYIQIISENNYPKTKGYMINNAEFLSKIVERKSYDDFDSDDFKYLSKVLQNADSIKNALIYGNEFAIQYFSEIVGFTDYYGAAAFINIIESNETLLVSESVYDNVYMKLVNPYLKAKYTNLRKRIA